MAWQDWRTATACLSEHLGKTFVGDTSLPEFEILFALRDGGRQRMSVLADASGQSPSRLAHAIRRMERRGLVERVTCRNDKRGVYAQITEDGTATFDRLAPEYFSVVASRWAGKYTPEELDTLMDLVGRIIEK